MNGFPPSVPAWPDEWTCWALHADVNLPTPLDVARRCSVRYATLEEAKVGCDQRSPECSGIVRDNGFVCRGRGDGGREERLLAYELRDSLLLEASLEVTSWLRTACDPPLPPTSPPPVLLTAEAGVAVACMAVAALAVWTLCVVRVTRSRMRWDGLSPLQEEGEMV